MVASALIGSLRVALGIDTAQFSSDANKARGILNGLSGTIKAFAVGAASAFSVGAVTLAVKSAAERMDELGKSAQKIGIPVEQLSTLEHAARLADLSIEGLTTNMNKFNKMLGEIAKGASNTASIGLKAIGVAALDANGKLRPTSEILADVAEKFASYRDGAEKSALAMAIFGKSGAEMIPLLNGGRDALREATNEAKLFGLTVSKQAAAQAEMFNDNLTRLKMSLEGLAQRITTAILPAMNSFIQSLVDYLGKGGGAQKVTEGFLSALKKLAEISVQLYYNFQKFSISATYWWDRLNGAPYDPARYNQLKADLASVEEQYIASAKAVQNFSFEPGNDFGSFGKSSPSVEKPAAPILPNLVQVKKEASAAAKAMRDLKAEGKQVYESVRGPVKEYQDNVARLSVLLKAGAIDQQTYGLALKQYKSEFEHASESMKTMGQQVSETMQGAFKSWIDSALNGTFKLKDATMDLLHSLTKLAMNNAFSMMNFGGGHALYGGGGSLIGNLLGGLVGFAKGGTILPSGTGGIDSQLVAFRKSPNERVDITKPGQTLSSSGGGVTIIDQRRNAPPIEQSEDGSGNIQMIIRDELNRTINQGYADGSLSSRYSVKPSRTRR